MAQATHTHTTKKFSRKELRQPDEFVTFTQSAIDWANVEGTKVSMMQGVKSFGDLVKIRFGSK